MSSSHTNNPWKFQPISFLAEFIAHESFPPSLHAPLCLLLRVFVPFLDDLPYGTSLERVDSALRDFSTHLTQITKSPLFQSERSRILSILEPPTQINTFSQSDSSNNDVLVAHLNRQIKMLRSANELIERQFQDYRQNQNAEFEQLIATHTIQLTSENNMNLTEISRLRAKVAELKSQIDSVTVSNQKLIVELK
jgi:hypothetical protein